MKGNFLMVYWDFLDEATPEASLLLSYLVDLKKSGLMRKWDGGYFRLSNSFIQERFLTWSQHTIKKNLDELEEKGFIVTKQMFQYENGNKNKTRWVMVTDKTYNLINGLTYDQPNNLNDDLPNDLTENFNINNNTITQYHQNTIYYDETSSSSNPPSKKELFSEESTLSNCPDPSDTAEKYSAEINEIVAYLNEKTQSSYRTSTGNTRKHIVARLKQCYTVADFKYVIDVKCAEWLNDPKMAQYLRPETLFTERNFENYLQQKMPVNKNGTPQVNQRKARVEDLSDQVF